MKLKAFLVYGAGFLVLASVSSLFVFYSAALKKSVSGELSDSFVAAKVDGVEITGADIRREMFMADAPERKDQKELERQRKEALDMLVQLQLLKAEASRRGITISDDAVEERIQRYALDPDTLRVLLTDNNMTEEEFRSQLREDMLIEQLGNQVRAELAKSFEVGEDEIEAFYQKNRELYNTSEVAHIYVRVPPPGGEEQVAQARKKAQEIADKAARGESFEQLARQFSDDTSTSSNGGRLGPLNSGLLPNTFIEAARKLAVGETTREPLQVQNGFHIIKRLTDSRVPIDEARSEIRQRLLAPKVNAEFEQWLNGLREKADVKIFL